MQSNKSPRFSMTSTPALDGFLQVIWSAYPHLAGSRQDTILFAVSMCAYELSKRGEVATTSGIQPAEMSKEEPKEIDPFDNLDEIEC